MDFVLRYCKQFFITENPLFVVISQYISKFPKTSLYFCLSLLDKLGDREMTMNAVIYARVSTNHQTTENQLRELREVAVRLGYSVVAELTDDGISGGKGKKDRPAFDRLSTMIQRKEIDIILAWSIDRLGRSITDLVSLMSEIQSAGVDLYVHMQSINSKTASGRMIFNVFASLAEFEREMIRERINAGLSRVKAEGKKLGRPSNVNDGTKNAVRELRLRGMSLQKIAKTLRIGVGTTSLILQAA